MKIPKRWLEALAYRDRGLTFEQMGLLMNVSAARARDIYVQAKYRQGSYQAGTMGSELPTRAVSLLKYRFGLDETSTQRDVAPYLPLLRELMKAPPGNFSYKSFMAIETWLRADEGNGLYYGA